MVRTTAGQFRYLLLNLVNLRDLSGVGTKLKETIFNNNNQINSTVTARTRVLQQNGPDRGKVQDWYSNQKMVVVPVCLNGRCCSSVCVGVVSCKPRWRRWVSVSSSFSKTCSHGRLPSIHVGIRNIPSNVSYDDTKHYQVQSEHRRTQNPFKYLRWSVFA